ncbi:MAG: ferredoxin [Candidatus Dadabacteria bacterium]|nr:MAG: ferredoxin [Candidatus Dadabacteria bacterium]
MISRVWIEEGCISCSLCQDYVPEVFHVEDGEDCVIRPDAGDWFEAREEDIRQAAEDCPVEVIRIAVQEASTPAP